ncbi:histidinol-phosphate transaminase [Candidatus Sumerlaeota bacterium]|nr:histidinol-phosphate transaminase [Candidatus Sumerlaeota bacterium]
MSATGPISSEPTPNSVAQRLTAYTPGEQPQEHGWIKLNTNEFPYPAAPEVLEAIRRAATDDIRLYPSPRCDALRETLARHHGVSRDMIFVGNGSDEILRLLAAGYGGDGRVIATVDPTYSLFPTLIELSASQSKVYLLDNRIDLPESMFADQNDLLFLPIPNPPLGTVFPSTQLRQLLNKVKLLVIDEAYADFMAENPHTKLLADHANLALSRTFSKSFGLAGLRIGYAIAHPLIIETLSKLADSYNVNRISQVAAIAAIESRAYYRSKVEQIRCDRDCLRDELVGRGFAVPYSHGNFLFAIHPKAAEIYQGLRNARILVRYFAGGRLADGLRITIGTKEQLASLLAALDNYLR